ncbi:MAG: nucleotidyl transferase AbiEii/AbiGii toxin family protein [Methanobacteriota archaeon]
MVKIKIISENKLKYLAGEKGFNLIYLEKDYFLTLLLCFLSNIKGIYFKGGTALNKIFLNHTRLSEDLDFSCKGGMSHIKDQIIRVLEDNKNIFPRYVFDSDASDFFRLKIFYRSFFSKTDHLTLDVNRKASVFLQPQKQRIPHFYGSIPQFEIVAINLDELIAEKIRALITRNQPRDYFDAYMILEKGYKINLKLVRKKLADVKQKFEVERIFKNAQKIYSKWDIEISQLTNKPVEFMTVIKRLQKEFKYKSKSLAPG